MSIKKWMCSVLQTRKLNSMILYLCFISITVCKSNSRIETEDKGDLSEDHDDIQSDIIAIYNDSIRSGDYSNLRSNCVGTLLVCKAKRKEKIDEDTCFFT